MTATKSPTFLQAGEQIVALAADISYQPSDAERGLKALLAVVLEDNPARGDWDQLTAAAIEQITNDGRIHRWWSKPGFKEWLTNKHEFLAKSTAILDKLLDSFYYIAADPDPQSYGAKVAAAKLLAALTGRGAKAAKTKILDASIPDEPEELKAYIAKLEKKIK